MKLTDFAPSVTAILTAIKLAVSVRRGNAESDNEQRLALQLWGSMLFEMRANCERVRYLLHRVNGDGWRGFFQLSFSVSEAVLPELCRLAPEPITLSQMEIINSALKTIDFFQKAAGSALGDSPAVNEKIDFSVGFAGGFRDRRNFERFNLILGLAEAFGKAVYGDEWTMLSPGLLPDRLDLSKPPSEDVL